jgi:hypothetical protein
MTSLEHKPCEDNMTEPKKTIVITWADTRPGYYGEVCAALWAAEGDDNDLNAALAYVAKETRKYGHSSRVHTFPVDAFGWKAAAVEAHNNGCGL